MDAGKLMLIQVNLFLLARVGWQRGWRGGVVGATPPQRCRDEDPSHGRPCESGIRAAVRASVPSPATARLPLALGTSLSHAGVGWASSRQMVARNQHAGRGHISLINAN